jgi:hypothetical protein
MRGSEVDVPQDEPLRRRHSPLIAEAAAGKGGARSALLEAARPMVYGWVTGRVQDLDVFKLVDLEGLRPCEAARELHRSQAGVRSNLCRARKKIRELILDSRRNLARELWPDPAT